MLFALALATFYAAVTFGADLNAPVALLEDLANLGSIGQSSPIPVNRSMFTRCVQYCESSGYRVPCFCTPEFQGEMLRCAICIDGAYVATDNPARAQSKADVDMFSDFCFNVTVYSKEITQLPSTAFTAARSAATENPSTAVSGDIGGGNGSSTSTTKPATSAGATSALVTTTAGNSTTAAGSAMASTPTPTKASSAVPLVGIRSLSTLGLPFLLAIGLALV